LYEFFRKSVFKMATIFNKYELPIADSMIAAARRIRPRRDGRHPFEQYFLFWTAFNNIYTTISHGKGFIIQLKENDDGSIVTIANGNVNIPDVIIVSEEEQIKSAFEEFTDDLKHSLILHEGTKFFVDRIPFWEGVQIKVDSFGQRVNGVIKINQTCNSDYPVWSPIDTKYYEDYLDNPENEGVRDLLARQIVEMLYTVRNNFMYAGKKLDDANNIDVVKNALPMLELIVMAFIR
jgi:hypothetical protein